MRPKSPASMGQAILLFTDVTHRHHEGLVEKQIQFEMTFGAFRKMGG